MELDELKQIWNNRNTDAAPEGVNNNENLISHIYSAEKKTKLKYLIASVAMAAELAVFIYILFFQNFFTGLSYWGVLLIAAAIVSGIATLFSAGIKFKKTEFSSPSIHFLKNILLKYSRRKLIRKFIIPVYLAAISAGFTLVFIEQLSAVSAAVKYTVYSASYLYIILIYIITSKKEIKKEKNELQPIIDKITSLISQIESGK